MTLKPLAVAIGLVTLSLACLISGVYLLLGVGWALIASAPAFAAVGLVILRGVLRASAPRDSARG